MAETDFKYDVFISYSHKDEGWADKVLRQRLDDAGFKVCIDYRDFEAGKMALLNMQDAAKQSKHVVLVLTRNWLNSEWSLFEALVGGTKDPAGFQKKLIPLLCEAGIEKDINDFIAMRTWVDFTRKDREAIAWKQLFNALDKPNGIDYQLSQERVLEAAIEKQISVGQSTQLFAWIKRSGSGSIITSIGLIDEDVLLDEETVRSKTLEIEFPVENGKTFPAKLLLQLTALDFNPSKQQKIIEIHPEKDSEICTFTMVPNKAGKLLLSLEVIRDEVNLVTRTLRTTAIETEEKMRSPLILVSVPIVMYVNATSKAKTSNLQPETHWFYGHRYGDLENFTGRAAEMQMLDEWLGNDKDNLLVLTAFGGFGKSALTWQWFNNRVDKSKWPTAVWWSFYEKESGFESFLAETLAHLGVEVKASARVQVNDLLVAMRGTKVLFVLDGFERLLRQYGRMDAALQSDDEDAAIDPSQRDCSSPLTETFLRGLSGAGLKSKVLLTTRLCPRVLESADGKLLKGCREAPLAAFSPEDAVTYFHNEGIKATRAETSALCAAYGYHPLSLSLLVGLINADHERRGDIEAVKNLEIFEDVKARRHHVLERAYGSLAPERRDLLSKMSCFRGSMEHAVLKKVFPSPDLDKSLLDLRQRGLLLVASHQSPNSQFTNSQSTRFDMHPIVRHYAYDHFTDEKRRREAHVQLAMHFIDAMPVTNTKVKTLEDLTPVIELYHHMVGAGNLDEAWKLFRDRLQQAIYFQFGAYQIQIELLRALFLDGEDKPPRLKREDAQAWTLNELAGSYLRSGQTRHVVPLMELQTAIHEEQGDKRNLARGLGNVATQQLVIGALSNAERNLRRAISLSQEINNEVTVGTLQYLLGQLLVYCGNWNDSEKFLRLAEEIKEKSNHLQAQSVIWSYRALRFLFMAREEAIFETRKSNNEYRISSIESAQRALELADEQAKDIPVPRDYVRAHWLLGAAYRMNNELTLAEENLSKALNLCRQINMVDHEANILLDVARLSFAYALREAQGSAQDRLFEEAKSHAEEALVITERSGYVLQGADVNLFLAELASLAGNSKSGIGLGDWGGKEMARKYAEEALRLATCDGPPYYYKVAYEEAERMLEKLK